MNFQLDTRYPGPSGNRSEWFTAALRDVRESRVGDVPITVELTDERGAVFGSLSSVREPRDGEVDCSIVVAVADDLSTISCRDIAWFVLHRCTSA
jgi:hypothetical protein